MTKNEIEKLKQAIDSCHDKVTGEPSEKQEQGTYRQGLEDALKLLTNDI